MPRAPEPDLEVRPSSEQHFDDNNSVVRDAYFRRHEPESKANGDGPDYVPPEPPPDEPLPGLEVSRTLAVVVSSVSAVLIWESGFGAAVGRASVWGQVGLIVAGLVVAVAIERFVKLAELQFKAWQTLRQIDQLLKNVDRPERWGGPR